MNDKRPYLDYLEKEMTIMGVLSAVCIALPAFVLDKIAGATTGALYDLWKDNGDALKVSGISLLVGALFFYKERSLLAWYYGQIAIGIGEDDQPEITRLVDEADCWSTWTWYSLGFDALILGGALFVAAIVARTHTLGPQWILPFIGVALLAGSLQTYVFCRYRWKPRPWSELLPWLEKLHFECAEDDDEGQDAGARS